MKKIFEGLTHIKKIARYAQWIVDVVDHAIQRHDEIHNAVVDFAKDQYNKVVQEEKPGE